MDGTGDRCRPGGPAPGMGRTAWARRVARAIDFPECLIDASMGLASFCLVGVGRGWGAQGPGRPLTAMSQARTAKPLVVVDEICKAANITSDRGHTVSFQPALPGLMERESAMTWTCPGYRVRFDMSHLGWVLLANDVSRVTGPVRSRCWELAISARMRRKSSPSPDCSPCSPLR